MEKYFATNPKFIQVKETNRTIIKIIFYSKYKRQDSVKNKLMSRMLTSCNANYRTYKEFEKKKDELLIMEYWVENVKYNDICITIFNLTIPKEGIISSFKLEEAIKFFYDSIFNPCIIDEEFETNQFNWEKSFLYDKEKDYPRNIYQYLDEEVIKIVNEKEKTYIAHEEYMDMIKQATPKNVYQYYQKAIKNNSFITYICGNVDNKDKLLKIYNKYFKQEKENIKIDINCFKPLKIENYKENVITTKYNQSVLVLFYQIENFTKKEQIILETLYFFLSSRENDLLFNNLRNKHNLIYTLDVKYDKNKAFLIIKTYLNKKDIEKAQIIIQQTIEDIKIKENFELYKENLLKALKYDMYFAKDNIFNDVNETIEKEVKDNITLEEKYEQINKIQINDMINFIDRLKLIDKLTAIGD